MVEGVEENRPAVDNVEELEESSLPACRLEIEVRCMVWVHRKLVLHVELDS